MKIEGYSLDVVQGHMTERTEGAGGHPGQAAASSSTGGGDQVRLSHDVQAVQAAASAAQQAPEIRQDVVDRMRALLDAGQVGSDLGKLADALLDHWIQTP